MSWGWTVRQVWMLWALAVAVAVATLVLSHKPIEVESPPVGPASTRLVSVPSPLPTPASALAIETWAASLEQSTLWGPRAAASEATAAPPATPEPVWAVTGTFRTGGKSVAVVSWERLARPSIQRSVGEELPDRSRILVILADRIQIQPPGRRELPRWIAVNRGAVPPADQPPAHAPTKSP